MSFSLLQSRLTLTIRRMVQSGQWTERRIALTTGVSQPHIHNVLKGARGFSPEISDRIMERLNLSFRDLMEEHSNEKREFNSNNSADDLITIPIFDGRLRPGYPFPAMPGDSRRFFPAEDVRPLRNPAVFRLAPDPACPETPGLEDWALLDLTADIPPSAWLLAVETGGEGKLMTADQRAELSARTGDCRIRGYVAILVKANPKQPIPARSAHSVAPAKTRVRIEAA